MTVIELDGFSVPFNEHAEAGSAGWLMQLLNLAVAFFEFDVKGQVWHANGVAKELLDEEYHNVDRGQGLFENESLKRIIDDFLLDPEPQLTKEILIKRKHEPWQTFIMKCEKIIEASGNVKVRGLFFEVTMKKQHDLVDSQLQKLQSLGQLTSGVSHDFNNQLNGILGYVALMKNVTADPTLMRYLEGIERSIHYSTKLTRQLLSFAHKVVDEQVNFDLVQVLNDTVGMLRHIVDRRIKINLDIEDKEFNVMGDSSQLNNAILNLCLNSRDAITGSGSISISLKMELLDDVPGNFLNTALSLNYYAVLRVADTGCGMDEKILTKILSPFFTTKGVGKGTGMGLPMISDAIKRHNGALTVESEVGKGTAFTVYLPTCETIESELEENKGFYGSGKILLIDDEESNLEITHGILEGYGYQVTSFPESKMALTHYAKHMNEYECILLDVIMPEMSGVDVFKAIKLINPDSKVVLLTGVSDFFELDFVLRQGADAYITKPVDHRTLSYEVFSVINSNLVKPKNVEVGKLVEIGSTLNISTALERIAGNVNLYFKISKKFRKQFYMIVEYLPQLIKVNLKEAQWNVHTIKGLAGQLGAEELYEYSRELEAALAAKKPVDDILSIFLEEFMEISDELMRLEKVV